MKKSYYLFPVLVTTLVMGLIVLITNLGSSDFEEIVSKEKKWEIKQKEIRSRLLAVPILLYHDIDGKGIYSITSETLREHFQYFKDNNIVVVPLDDLLYRLENPTEYNCKTVVITFDDGFLSMYTKMYPLAKEFNYPVTLFVYTDFVRERAKRMITWKKLREMDRNGIDIQCHTKSHADLTELIAVNSLENERKIFEEVFLSKQVLEMKLRKKIDYIAYPYGRYNLKLIQLSKRANYTRVFSTNSGSNIITRNNYCLNRHHILRTYSLKKIEKILNNLN